MTVTFTCTFLCIRETYQLQVQVRPLGSYQLEVYVRALCKRISCSHLLVQLLVIVPLQDLKYYLVHLYFIPKMVEMCVSTTNRYK